MQEVCTSVPTSLLSCSVALPTYVEKRSSSRNKSNICSRWVSVAPSSNIAPIPPVLCCLGGFPQKVSQHSRSSKSEDEPNHFRFIIGFSSLFIIHIQIRNRIDYALIFLLLFFMISCLLDQNFNSLLQFIVTDSQPPRHSQVPQVTQKKYLVEVYELPPSCALIVI